MTADAALFPGFEAKRVRTSNAEIAAVIGGDGPPLLLLHGYPQMHAMWHKVAAVLAQQFTVVCSDLRGYGDSSKPEGGERHVNYSKRVMAEDQVELMQALGFARFGVAGHDRGGRVAHRLTLDHPQAVTKLAVLDISPTRVMYGRTDKAFATAYYHWFFLIQPYDLPERMIGADPAYYLRKKIGGWSRGLSYFDPRALAEYERCFRDPAMIHASCEDYRAAAGIDLEHDAQDESARIECPLLALWGDEGVVNRLFKPLDDWRSVALDVRGRALRSGHFLPEEAPEDTCAELLHFFR
ncbi:MAG: alpha/beta hydrolase [Pseudomonadota bacterium]|nr:alpha/beta hydrolase [Pseudomonadota bacterium]